MSCALLGTGIRTVMSLPPTLRTMMVRRLPCQANNISDNAISSDRVAIYGQGEGFHSHGLALRAWKSALLEPRSNRISANYHG